MVLFTREGDTARITESLVAMRDGVRLYTRCTVPKDGTTFPIVFIRTPYEPAHNGTPHNANDPVAAPYIERGYAVVTQHCRGKGDSEGDCIPYSPFERTDALDTLEYIRALPFYQGEIYLTGGSYLATVHLSYLSAKPHDVKGACLQIQTDRLFYRNYRNGLNYRLNNIGWWSSMVSRVYPNADLSRAYERPYIDAAKRVFGRDIPEFTDTLIHNTCDEFWQNDDKWNVVESLEIPTLFVEGWYDFYVEGMSDMWRRLPGATKAKSAMLVGPYGHSTVVSKKAEYPLPSGNIPGDFVLDWFDSIREGRPIGFAERGKVKYYSIGADAWYAADGFDGCRAYDRLWLGDHTLSRTEGEGAVLGYDYDPEHVANVFPSFDIFRAHAAGSVDSILSFVSEPIASDTAYFGGVRVHLNVSSDCEDTAFYARIYLVDGGEAYNLTEAFGGLVHLTGDYTPGTVATIDLETPPIAFTLKAGMRVRVDIASESGNYLPHPNVEKTQIAHNEIHTKGSYVALPLQK